MTWGITVAPRMPAASRMLPEPSRRGTSIPEATSGTEGRARKTSNAKAATITPTRPAITASSWRTAPPRGVGGELAGAHEGPRRDEGWPEKRQQRRQPGSAPRQRTMGGQEDAPLTRQRRAGRLDLRRQPVGVVDQLLSVLFPAVRRWGKRARRPPAALRLRSVRHT